mgnify:CR=1 FL=1
MNTVYSVSAYGVNVGRSGSSPSARNCGIVSSHASPTANRLIILRKNISVQRGEQALRLAQAQVQHGRAAIEHALESAAAASPGELTETAVQDAIQRKVLLYDKGGDQQRIRRVEVAARDFLMRDSHRDVIQVRAAKLLIRHRCEHAQFAELAHQRRRQVLVAVARLVRGHQFALNIAVGLGLGGNESYPQVFAPFGGFADECKVVDSRVPMPDVPGGPV